LVLPVDNTKAVSLGEKSFDISVCVFELNSGAHVYECRAYHRKFLVLVFDTR